MIGRRLYHLNFPSEKIFVQSEMHTIKWETNQPIKFNSAENGLIMDYIRLVRSTNDEHVAFFGRRRSIPKSPPQNVDLNRLGRLLSGYWRHLWTFPFFPFKFIELPPFPRLFFCFRRRIEWNNNGSRGVKNNTEKVRRKNSSGLRCSGRTICHMYSAFSRNLLFLTFDTEGCTT